MNTQQKTGFEFDQGAAEVLVICHDCDGTWRAFAWSQTEAEYRAAAHEARCHPGSQELRQQLAKRRHAQRKKSSTRLEIR